MKQSPENNIFGSALEKAKSEIKNQMPFFVKRHLATKNLKEKGFERFDDFRLLNIGITKVSKINQPYYPESLEIKDQEIFGDMQIESPLLGDEPVKMVWKAFIQVHLPRNKFDTINFNIFYGWKSAEDNPKSDYHWINRDPSIPAEVCERGKKMGLDDYGIYAKGFYEFGKDVNGNENCHDTPYNFTEPFVKYYDSLKWRVMQKMKEYLWKYALPQLSIKDRNRESFYKIDIDASTKSEEELDEELAEAFLSSRVDSKYIYLLGGSEAFLETTKSEEYKLYDTEKSLLRENKVDLAQIAHPIIYDLGCGDGKKARIILEEKLKSKTKAIYHPVDIAPRMIIEACVTAPEHSLPEGMLIDFTKTFKDKIKNDGSLHSFLLLGNTLGNGNHEYQINLLKNISQSMEESDNLIIGVQMNYDFKEILKMYQTPESLDLARPMLRGLGFNDDDIDIYIKGDEEKKEISLNIKLLKDVNLKIGKHNINLKQDQIISLITSQKYDITDINQLAKSANLKIVNTLSNQDDSYSLITFENNKRPGLN